MRPDIQIDASGEHKEKKKEEKESLSPSFLFLSSVALLGPFAFLVGMQQETDAEICKVQTPLPLSFLYLLALFGSG